MVAMLCTCLSLSLGKDELFPETVRQRLEVLRPDAIWRGAGGGGGG